MNASGLEMERDVDNHQYSDGILFRDLEGNDEVIFNYLTWVEIIKAIIVEFSKKTPQAAEELVINSSISNIPPANSNEVFILSHELEYHWAMLIVHGERYWSRGVSSKLPEGYFEWDHKYRVENGLAKESFVHLAT